MFKNKFLIATLCLCGLLFGLMPVSYAASESAALSNPVGRVVWIKGDFKALMANKEARILKKSSIIYEKDTLVTGENSQAQIVFTDNTLMTFRERTEFFVNQYSYDAKSKSKSVGKYVMKLIEGGFRTITGLIAQKNPNDYSIETPVATIGVRGTDYTVYFRKGEMFIGFEEGIPCVTSKKDEGKSVCLDEENKYVKIDEAGVPVPLALRPDVLGPTLEIVPARIQPFTTVNEVSPGSVVNSFCIT